jgi:hypothetical protein
VRAPLSFVILAAIVVGIAFWVLLLATNYVDVDILLTNFISFIAHLVIGTIMAVLVTTVVGMYLSLRMLVRGRTTPFESSMLDMKETLDELDRRLCNMGLQQCANWPDDADVPHPTKFRPRVPRTYWLVLGALLALTLWMFLLFTNIVRLGWDLRLQFIGFTSMIVVIVIGAVVGAFFFGMFLGHRIITRGSFTPFETSMMQMKERLSRMEDHIGHLQSGEHAAEKREGDDGYVEAGGEMARGPDTAGGTGAGPAVRGGSGRKGTGKRSRKRPAESGAER